MNKILKNMNKGIDISAYQKNIDFNCVKKHGISFVFIKATKGTNATFHDNAYFNNRVFENFIDFHRDLPDVRLIVLGEGK